jgi:hypothetical protein
MFAQRQGGAEGAWQRYETEATTQQLGKQTSKVGIFFAGNRLSISLQRGFQFLRRNENRFSLSPDWNRLALFLMP